MDNGQQAAPVIPSGTERTVYGTASYMGNAPFAGSSPVPVANGQAVSLPSTGQSEAVAALAQQSGEAKAPLGTTFDDLAVKKGFRNADDLAAAYENLESQNKRVEMSLAELVKLREQTIPQSEIAPDELNQVQTQEDALKVVERVVKKFTRPLEDKLALQELFHNNPDAPSFASDMAKLVKENPGVSWAVAYRAAKFEALDKQSREKGRQEAYQTIQQKQAATVSQPATPQKSAQGLKELIGDKSIPFREVTRIMKERFSQ